MRIFNLKRIQFLFLAVYSVLLVCAPVSIVCAQDVKSNTVAAAKSAQNAHSLNYYKTSDPVVKRMWETGFIVIIGYLIVHVLVRFINAKVSNVKSKHALRKNVVYIVTFTLIIIVFSIWIQNLNSITIFLGVASAGLALALQEVILSIAGWVLILTRKPYEAGDRIEINGVKGDVIDIRFFQTSLLEIGNWVNADQSTGRIVNIPNSFLFKAQCYNYSRGFEFIWNEIPIVVTFESDWQRARDIILRHAQEMAAGMEDTVSRKIDVMKNRYMIYYGKLTPIVYVNIKDSGIELTLRYLTEAKKRRSTQCYLCEKILEDFGKEPTVNFAYNTFRIVKE